MTDHDVNDHDSDDVEDTSEVKDVFKTGWAKIPTVADLKQDLNDARSDHDTHVAKVRKWLDNLNVTGSARIPKSKSNSSLVPKVIRKQAEWRYAALSEPFLSTNDIFDVDPVTFEDKEAAVQNALVLNNQLNTKINKVAFIDDYVRTVVDEGTVIVRVGWDYEDEQIEEEVIDYDFAISQNPDAQAMLAAAAQDLSAPPEMLQAVQLSQQNQAPILPVPIGKHIETKTKVLKNCPTLTVCEYDRLIIDPSARGIIEKAGFVIYMFETNKADLNKAGYYKNIDDIRIDSVNPLALEDSNVDTNTSFNFSDDTRKKVMAYEYWGNWDVNGDGTTVPIVATWVGSTLIRLQENPFPDQLHPFVSVPYLPVRKSNFGEPDGELIEENQLVIGAVTRGMIDVMARSANGQIATRKDALDMTNKRKLEKGMDYEFNAGVDPRQAFHVHTYPEIPQSAQFMLAMQNADAESLTGVKAFSGSAGISGKALGENVGGIKSALDATAKRELGILRRLAEGMKQIGRKIISMNAEFLSDVEVIRITNEQFVEVKRDDLEGNFDLKLSISTPEADDAKAQELAFMLQTTSQSMGPDFTRVILAEIATLRKMPDLANQIKKFQPKPDPIAEQKAQLELQLLQAQVETEKSKAQENYANAQLDTTKAENLGSDTDLKNLDFVEQESGVTQERDLEKASRQAEGNMVLENIKHRNKLIESQVSKQN